MQWGFLGKGFSVCSSVMGQTWGLGPDGRVFFIILVIQMILLWVIQQQQTGSSGGGI